VKPSFAFGAFVEPFALGRLGGFCWGRFLLGGKKEGKKERKKAQEIEGLKG